MARHDGGCPDVGTMARALWWLWWNVLQKLDVEVLAWLVMESWSVADSSSQVCNLFLFSLYLHIVCIWFVLKQAHPLIHPQSSILNHIITSSHHQLLFHLQWKHRLIHNQSHHQLITNQRDIAHPLNVAPPCSYNHTLFPNTIWWGMYCIISIFLSLHTNVYKYYTLMRQEPSDAS